MIHKLMPAIAIALLATACSVSKETPQKEEITFPEKYKDVRKMSSREDEGVLLNPSLFFEYLEKGILLLKISIPAMEMTNRPFIRLVILAIGRN